MILWRLLRKLQVAILNNEEDWRNGMRVKLLKQMSKYGQSAQHRQSHRGFDSEKSSIIRTSEAGISTHISTVISLYRFSEQCAIEFFNCFVFSLLKCSYI